jgi:hypothetical protein
MGVPGNGVGRPNGTAAAAGAPAAKTTERKPRRLVLLAGEPNGPAASVLAEYQGSEVSGNRLHADLQRLSEENAGRYVAAEWLGPLGWTRFLWRRK